MLNNVKTADEPVDIPALCMMIYAHPGCYKTSAGFTTKNPIVFDFDKGAHRSAFCGLGARVEVDSWKDVRNLEAADLVGYDTVVIDTAGRCVESLMHELAPTGEMNQYLWGKLKSEFSQWVNRIRSAGVNIVLTAHVREEKENENIVLRPDIAGGSKAELYKLCEVIACFRVRGTQPECVIEWNDKCLTKAPTGMRNTFIPNFEQHPTWLGDFINNVQSHLDSYQKKARETRAKVKTWTDQLDACKTVAEVNELLPAILKIDPENPIAAQVGTALRARAKALGATGYKNDKFLSDDEAPTKKDRKKMTAKERAKAAAEATDPVEPEDDDAESQVDPDTVEDDDPPDSDGDDSDHQEAADEDE